MSSAATMVLPYFVHKAIGMKPISLSPTLKELGHDNVYIFCAVVFPFFQLQKFYSSDENNLLHIVARFLLNKVLIKAKHTSSAVLYKFKQDNDVTRN